MARPPVSDDVAAELEHLSLPGEAHDSRGEHSTMVRFSERDRVRRGARVMRDYLQRQVDVPRDGRAAVVTAGPPGAGKTTVLRDAGLIESHFRNIDADIVKEMLLNDALRDGTFDALLSRRLADGNNVRPHELAPLVHRESSAIAENITRISLSRGENVLIQGTLGWDEQPRVLLASLHQNDYAELTIFDVEVDLATAMDRALERWWIGRNDLSHPLGGRFVPAALIRSLYLADGTTMCRANADVMLALSDRMSTELRRSTSSGGVRSLVIQKRDLDVERSLTSAEDST